MFVVFDHGADVFRMDTETGETWQLFGSGAEFSWVAVKEPADRATGFYAGAVSIQHES